MHRLLKVSEEELYKKYPSYDYILERRNVKMELDSMKTRTLFGMEKGNITRLLESMNQKTNFFEHYDEKGFTKNTVFQVIEPSGKWLYISASVVIESNITQAMHLGDNWQFLYNRPTETKLNIMNECLTLLASGKILDKSFFDNHKYLKSDTFTEAINQKYTFLSNHQLATPNWDIDTGEFVGFTSAIIPERIEGISVLN